MMLHEDPMLVCLYIVQKVTGMQLFTNTFPVSTAFNLHALCTIVWHYNGVTCRKAAVIREATCAVTQN